VKLLLDTQCWLWWFSEPERLNENAIAHIADETNELWFSVASIWEMGIKVAIGKLPLPEPIDGYISSRMVLLDVQYLEIRSSHALRSAALPLPYIIEIPLLEC
jgi:PIN domain nuclease of toxin-antitoxin system